MTREEWKTAALIWIAVTILTIPLRPEGETIMKCGDDCAHNNYRPKCIECYKSALALKRELVEALKSIAVPCKCKKKSCFHCYANPLIKRAEETL